MLARSKHRKNVHRGPRVKTSTIPWERLKTGHRLVVSFGILTVESWHPEEDSRIAIVTKEGYTIRQHKSNWPSVAITAGHDGIADTPSSPQSVISPET